MDQNKVKLLKEKLERLRYFKNNLSTENTDEFEELIVEIKENLGENYRIRMNRIDFYEIVDPRDNELPF
jgi:hypothetical protein